MKVFLDTEFTSLEQPKLISLGMVSEDGQEFYREFTDGWELAECSMFVIGWVLPWLSGGKVGETLTRTLGKHLDLIQLKCNIDNLFPTDKDELLVQAVKADPELLAHMRFLMKSHGAASLPVLQNPFVTKRFEGCRLESLLVGRQAQPTQQVIAEMLAWLKGFDAPIICVDSEYDMVLLQKLLRQIMCFELVENSREQKSELQLHHALDDAKALRLDWLAEKGL